MGVPRSRIRLVYSAPNPAVLQHARRRRTRRPGDARAAPILERYQIHYPFLLYAGAIRPQKNIPRLVEAFAIARTGLADHPEYRDLRLIIIGDEISRYPSVRQAVMQSRVEDSRALPRLRPLRHHARLLRSGHGVRLPVALRGLRTAAARSDGLGHAGHHLVRSARCRRWWATPPCWSIRKTSSTSRAASRRFSSTRRCGCS